jgi:hypothetical protein
MPKRCPPGVFCIENVTIIFICVIFVVLGLFIYIQSNNKRSSNDRRGNNDRRNNNRRGNNNRRRDENININLLSNESEKGYGNDVFFDIYKAPLRDDRCFTGGGSDIRNNPFHMPSFNQRNVPINISTQGCDDAKYRQVGILTRINGKEETILPLMGRPLFTRRDKWNFYTLNDKNNMIKLPITVKGRSGTDEYGCDNLYNGDTIFVEGYNDAFKVTTYDNQVMRYLPSL